MTDRQHSLLHRLGHTISATASVASGVASMVAAVPFVLWAGYRINDALSSDSAKERLLHRIVDLFSDLNDTSTAEKTDCRDCGLWGYGYMLKREVWESALTEKERDALSHKSSRHMILCLECVVQRLRDRGADKLTADDFDLSYPINWTILCAMGIALNTPAAVGTGSLAALRVRFEEAQKEAADEEFASHPGKPCQ